MHQPFSNGAEFMQWQSRNCEQCIKAVWYNEKRDYYPEYRCSIQRDIEVKAMLGEQISNRSLNATQGDCPYKMISRIKNKKVDKQQAKLFEL